MIYDIRRLYITSECIFIVLYTGTVTTIHLDGMLMKRLNIIIVLVYAYEYSFKIRTTILLLLCRG